MAGTSDPLEDMLFSEVDEKAVSDLVGSLESQLVGQGGSAASHTDSHSVGAAGTANHHLERALAAAPVGSVPEPQQQGARKTAVSEEPLANDCCSGKIAVPSTLSSAESYGEPPSTGGSGAKDSGGLRSHVPSGPGSLPLPPARGSVLGSEGSAVVSTGTDDPQNHIPAAVRSASAGTHTMNGSDGAAALAENPAKIAAPAAGSRAATLVNSVGSTVVTGNLSVTLHSAVSSATFSSSAQPDFSSSQTAASLDTRGAPSTALQRLPGQIMISVSHNGTMVPPLAPPGDAGAPVVNHSKSVDVGSAKVESSLPAAQPKVIVVSQAGVGTSHPSPVTCATPTASPTPAHLQSPGAPTVPVCNSSLPVGAPVKAAVQTATAAVSGVRPGAATPSSTHCPQVRPTATATQRIVAPQLIVRPPQQQTTIQLPPGFTIPPGMVLVRTEMGQLVMVPQQALAQAQAQAQNNIAPRQAAPTTGATFRVTTTQQDGVLIIL
ncbi:transcription initiation factor TFIID subunit 4-like [Arapaima gigas]